MRRLVTFALVGLVAQLVDGALGMAYGATSATLLLTSGTSPVVASASIHLAEVGTCFMSGFSHWRFGNVDWSVVRAVALPGAVGGFTGAVLLSNLDGAAAKPYLAAFLFFLGVVVVARFAFSVGPKPLRRRPSRRFLGGLGGVAGFCDAVGGGGWGPIATPTLLTTTAMSTRSVIGSVDTAEFVVTVAASIGFLLSLSRDGFDFALVGALLIGGVVAAPLAAYLVRYMNERILGTCVGGIILLTNARTFADVLGLPGQVSAALYLALATVWVVALASAVTTIRRQREASVSPSEAPTPAPQR